MGRTITAAVLGLVLLMLPTVLVASWVHSAKRRLAATEQIRLVLPAEGLDARLLDLRQAECLGDSLGAGSLSARATLGTQGQGGEG